MFDVENNFVITFNGEIYNYKELKQDLLSKGCIFHSETDTEVILNAYKVYGENFVEHLSGMFAFALYDIPKNTVLLVRDQAGVKPLYYTQKDGILFFASEIEALYRSLPFSFSLDYQGLYHFLSQNYIYDERTIYNEIKTLPSGCYLKIQNGTVTKKIYYKFEKQDRTVSFDKALSEFEQLFDTQVARTTRSDVPVGIFLSGGIDSSLIASAVAKSAPDTTAFTMRFSESNYDESHLAKEIAHYFGLKHTIIEVPHDNLVKDVSLLLNAFGQPFGDFSAIPGYQISRSAKSAGVTVILTGDGADDLFAGYPTTYLPGVLRHYQKFPYLLREKLWQVSKALPASHKKLGWEEKFRRFSYGGLHPYQDAHFFWKIIFSLEEIQSLFTREFLQIFSQKIIDEKFSKYFDDVKKAGFSNLEEATMVDTATFMVYDGLVKVDISSMLSSIETRTPFLNKEIMDFANALPAEYKVRLGKTKIILREMLRRRLPSKIFSLKKQGFTPPLAWYLKGPLKEFMQNTLSEENIQCVGILNPKEVTKIMMDHISGKKDHTRKIWGLLSLVTFLKNHKISF
jgi:asparagine synthase (glutamine-hydrolysing)